MHLRNHPSNEVIKVLTKHFGFKIDRQSGSHVLLKHPDGRRVTVPHHANRPIKEGTMKAIIYQIEVSQEEFLKYL